MYPPIGGFNKVPVQRTWCSGQLYTKISSESSLNLISDRHLPLRYILVGLSETQEFLVQEFFTQSQETHKTTDIAAMLVSQTKEIIKLLLLRIHQHGRHDVR